MTIREILTAVKAVKPSQYDEATLVRWISELEARIWQDVLCHYGDKDASSPLPFTLQDQNQRPLIPFPHDDIYIKWLFCQIDYHNGDFDRYNNGLVTFNAGLQAFADGHNRANMARQDNFIRM